MEIEEKLEWGRFATFVPNKKLPIYNWFYFKEGFSRDLVLNVIDMFELKRGDYVLDPFCGVGTTLLTCKELGINAIGYDTLPIAVFSSMVKTKDYEVEELKSEAKILLKKRFEKREMDFLPIMHRAFTRYCLEDIAFYRSEIKELRNADFFLLALINAAVKSSYIWKDGGVIKIKKRAVAPLKVNLKRTIYKMINDLKTLKTKKCKIVVEQCDARNMRLMDDCIDAIITSPPYLNQIDYTKVYKIENLFLGKPEPPIRSYIGLGKDLGREDKFLEELPSEAVPYFKDMSLALKEMYRVCKPKAKVAIVVGNAYFPEGIVDSDVILSKLAEETGYKCEKIYLLNKRFALVKRTKKKGILRESLIVLSK